MSTSRIQSESDARLLSLIERIERLTAEKKILSEDITEIKQEAKAAGYSVPVMMQMIKERAMDADKLAEWQALCDTYRASLGMLDGTPLGDPAMPRASLAVVR